MHACMHACGLAGIADARTRLRAFPCMRACVHACVRACVACVCVAQEGIAVFLTSLNGLSLGLPLAIAIGAAMFYRRFFSSS